MATAQRFLTITRVEDEDDGTLRVHGIAASESRADDGLVITADAMRKALPSFMAPGRGGPLREMHRADVAAGVVEEARVSPQGETLVVAHVVDPVACLKVRQQVYKGFSIRGKITARDPSDASRVTGLALRELSLVDLPADPEARFTLVRIAGGAEDLAELPIPPLVRSRRDPLGVVCVMRAVQQWRQPLGRIG